MRKYLYLLLSFSVLNGCATVPNASVENSAGKVGPNHGFVVAESLNNSTRIAGPIQKWTQIVLWRDGGGENTTFTINALNSSYSTQGYLGSVPAGTYRIGMLYAFRSGSDFSYSARALFPPDIGKFEVKPGQVTNLGTLLYQPFQARSWTDDSYPDYAITRISNDQLWTSTALTLPEEAAKIDSALPVLGWLPDEHDINRAKVAELMKKAALPISMHAVTDGFLLSGYFGGLYSQRNGQWFNHSIDSHYLITDVAELPSRKLLIGGEMGTLSVSGPRGENRHNLSFDTKLEHVLDIDVNKSGNAYLVTTINDEYNVYSFDADNEKVVHLKKIPKQVRGFLADAYNVGTSHPVMLSHNNGIAIYIDKIVHTYNENSKEWSTEKTLEFNSLSRQLNGVISGTPYSAWSGAKPLHFSTDDGESWTKISEKSGLFSGAATVPTYRFTDGEFLRTGKGEKFSIFAGWKVNESVPVLSSTDMGGEWNSVGSLPYGCANLALEASGDTNLYVLCDDGGVLKSIDRGRNWQLSLQPKIPSFDDFPSNFKIKYERE